MEEAWRLSEERVILTRTPQPKSESSTHFFMLSMSEEYDAKRQRRVGNTPQAFTHVGLVTAARTLYSVHSAAKHRSQQ